MKKITLILVLLISSFSFSQSIISGGTTMNSGAKGEKGDLPTGTEIVTAINGEIGTGWQSAGGGDSNVNRVAITNLAELQALTANKIASIQGDIDLGTATVNLPSNVILKFEGGSIINGTLNGDSTYIWSDELVKIFDLTTNFTGSFEFRAALPEWFGGGVSTVENIEYFRKTIEFIDVNNGGRLEVNGHGYYDFSSFAASGFWKDTQFEGKEGIIEIHDNTDFIISQQSTLRVVDAGLDVYTIAPIASISSLTITLTTTVGREDVPAVGEDFYIDGVSLGTIVSGSNLVWTLDAFAFTPQVGDIIKTQKTAIYNLIKFDNSKNTSLRGGHLEGNRDLVGNADQPSGIITYGLIENLIIDNVEISDFPADAIHTNSEGNWQGETINLYESGGINITTGANEVDVDKVRSVNKFDLTTSKIVENGKFMVVDQGSYGTINNVPYGKVNLFIYDVNDNFLEARLSQFMYEYIDLIPNADYFRVTFESTEDTRFDYTATGGETSVELDRLEARFGLTTSYKTYIYVDSVLLTETTDYTFTNDGIVSTVHLTTPLTEGQELLANFEYYRIDAGAWEVAKHVSITNCSMHDCGRQGISPTNFQGLLIQNNDIYNIYGSPGAAIDVEDGFWRNRRITIKDNTMWNCAGGYIIIYCTEGVVISGNRMLRATNELAKTNAKQRGVVVTNAGSTMFITNNFFEDTYSQFVRNSIVDNNTFSFSTLEVFGGTYTNNKFINSNFTITSSDNFSYASPVTINNNFWENQYLPKKGVGIFTSFIMNADLTAMQYPSFMNDNIVVGLDHNNSLNIKKGISVNNLTLINTSVPLLQSNTIDGLTAKGLDRVDTYYIPEDNEHVTYRNWSISGNTPILRMRQATTNLHHFIFDNLTIETDSATPQFIDIDNNLGSLIIKNSNFIARGSTGTAWSLINFDNTVTKFRMFNSEVVTGSAGNLLDKGTSTETASWIYKDNIFDTVILNNTAGTETNNIEE